MSLQYAEHTAHALTHIITVSVNVGDWKCSRLWRSVVSFVINVFIVIYIIYILELFSGHSLYSQFNLSYAYMESAAF